MPKKEIDYQELSEELDTVLSDLERSDIDVDKAIKLYERGMEIVGQLETYLKDAENKVTKIKQKFGE